MVITLNCSRPDALEHLKYVVYDWRRENVKLSYLRGLS